MGDVHDFPPFDPGKAGGGAPRLEGGIYVFTSVSGAEDAATEDLLNRLNAVAREKGWRQALVEIYGASGTIDYVTSDERLGMLPVLPLTPDQAVLEIGVSLGQIAIPIAKRVRTLDGIEVVRGQAIFAAERARQEGLTNVRIAAAGGDCRLPYPDRSFDGVVLNLVLEWCGSRSNEDHEVVQQRLLDEIARVLKPGGFFYLTTKNRFALRLLLGGRDEHMFERRWGEALPRWLGGALGGGKRPPGRLHSHTHLAAMLRRAGFSRLESFWAAPEMRRPTALIPLESNALRARRKAGGFAQGDSRKTKLIMSLLPNWLIKHVTPGLTFLAYR